MAERDPLAEALGVGAGSGGTKRGRSAVAAMEVEPGRTDGRGGEHDVAPSKMPLSVTYKKYGRASAVLECPHFML